MWTIRLTPDDPASECLEVGAEAKGTLPSRLPLQLQSETQRKLELRDRDMGDVCVPASNVGVSGRSTLSTQVSSTICGGGRVVDSGGGDGDVDRPSVVSSSQQPRSSVVLLVRMLSSTLLKKSCYSCGLCNSIKKNVISGILHDTIG